MSLPVKAVRFESDGRVARQVGVPGAKRECKKVRILYSRANYGLPRGSPLAAARMSIVMGFFTFHMFLKSCIKPSFFVILYEIWDNRRAKKHVFERFFVVFSYVLSKILFEIWD